jgi:acetyl esterase/lipase
MSLRALALTSGLLLCAVTCAHAQQAGLPLWPNGTPEPAQTSEPEMDSSHPVASLPTDHKAVSLSNVTVPTLTVYSPARKDNNGAAALVFPGGGYTHLAYTKEGTDTCAWLNSIGVTCLLVKYRVPEPHYPDSYADLEDAQQAIRLARVHAAEWHIDKKKIGVLGFSAGGNLAALMSTHSSDSHIASTPAAADANLTVDPRPDFAILVYPAYLAINPEQTTLDPTYQPNPSTPPTFVTAAENDRTYGKNALVYYRALLDAGIPSELHFFPTGGHGFGTFPVGAPAIWTDLATRWLQLQGIIPTPIAAKIRPIGPSSASPTPATLCPTPAPPTAGRPISPTNSNPDPNCPNP